MKYSTLKDVPLVWVELERDLDLLISQLQSVDQFAVDLEAHSMHSYQGFLCLMQVITIITIIIVIVIVIIMVIIILSLSSSSSSIIITHFTWYCQYRSLQEQVIG